MPATANQVSYARDLITKRDLTVPPPSRRLEQALARVKSGDRVSGFDCSDLITWLTGRPKLAVARPADQPARTAPMVTPGCFIMAGKIWVVTERVDKSGVYAKLLVECPDRIRDTDGERVPFELAYDRAMSLRALAALTEAHRMDFATARDYIVRYGQCFAPRGRGVCGIRLKAADSVEIGIGPVCGKFFPGYDQAVEELRAGRKHALYEQAREELGILLTDVQLYRLGSGLSTVAGIEKKLDRTPVNA